MKPFSHCKLVTSLTIVMLTLFVYRGFANTNTFYVSQTLGLDANDCLSHDTPCKTIQHSIDISPTGADIIVGDGKYHEAIVTKGQHLKGESDDPTKAIVWGASSIPINAWTSEGSNVYSTPWTHKLTPTTDLRGICTTVDTPDNQRGCPAIKPYAQFPDQIFVGGIKFQLACDPTTGLNSSGSTPTLNSKEFCPDYKKGKLYVGVDSSVNLTTDAIDVEVSDIPTLITLNGDGASFEGIGWQYGAPNYDATQSADMNINANNALVQNVMGTYSSNRALQGRSVSGLIVRNSWFYHNREGGVEGYQLHNALFENITIEYSNEANDFSPGWDTDGAKFARGDTIRVTHSTICANIGPALWADFLVQHVTFDNNTICMNGHHGIQVEKSQYGIIVRNLIVGSYGLISQSGGISIAGSSFEEVYNNTVKDSFTDIKIIDSDSLSAGIPRAVGNSIFNNVAIGGAYSPTKDFDLSYYHAYSGGQTAFQIVSGGSDFNILIMGDNPPTQAFGADLVSKKLTQFPTIAIARTKGWTMDVHSLDGVTLDQFNKDHPNAFAIGQPLPADVAAVLGLQPGAQIGIGYNSGTVPISPSPTPTIVATPTPVSSPSAVPSETPTSTESGTPVENTPTPVSTVTETPVQTPVQTPVATPSTTPTISATPTPTPRPTPTNTPSPVSTPTPKPTATPTPVATPTPTPVNSSAFSFIQPLNGTVVTKKFQQIKVAGTLGGKDQILYFDTDSTGSEVLLDSSRSKYCSWPLKQTINGKHLLEIQILNQQGVTYKGKGATVNVTVSR